MKCRSFLFALLRRTTFPTTKAERATETPKTTQTIFAVSSLQIGTPGVRASLVTEGYKQ